MNYQAIKIKKTKDLVVKEQVKRRKQHCAVGIRDGGEETAGRITQPNVIACFAIAAHSQRDKATQNHRDFTGTKLNFFGLKNLTIVA